MSWLHIGVLGPLQVGRGRLPVTITAGKQRSVLALLALRLHQVVTTEELVAAVWGDEPPDTATRTVQSMVSRLRSAIVVGEPAVLVRRGPGYRLTLPSEAVDVHRFEYLLTETQRSAPAHAAATLREALALWRGEPLADVPATPVIEAEAVRLAELRQRALADRIDADLALGRHHDVLGELQALTTAHPLRERHWHQLMLALYRSGRQGDALAAFTRARAALADELGLEPRPDLQDLQRRILTADPGLAPPTPESTPVSVPGPVRATAPAPTDPVHDTRPRQLPPDVASFTGREPELARLDALAAGGRAATVGVIQGPAGVGKTALAVHWAHRLADQFPDGQMCLNLRGSDPDRSPTAPAEALRILLDALDLPPHRIPDGLDAQVGLYRSTLAQRRTFILLDDARDAAQVRPLLPGAAGSFVLVTSRNQLAGLVVDGATPIPLEVLPPAAARKLLEDRIGTDRAGKDPLQVAKLVEACGGLPLALAIVAAQVAMRPEVSLAELADQLRSDAPMPPLLTGPDPATDLRPVFASSYETLDEGAARLFRLSSLHPGPELTVPAAASLAALPATATQRLLHQLIRGNLVAEHASGRYSMHDLVRGYAGELTQTLDDDADRHAARHRLLDHYLHTAHAASMAADPNRERPQLPPAQPGAVAGGTFTSDGAVAWFLRERRNLVAATVHADTDGFHTHAHQLARTLWLFLERGSYLHDQEHVQQAALQSAQRLGDHAARAYAHRTLGHTYSQLGRDDDAWQHLTTATTLLAELDDLVNLASTHHIIGAMHGRRGRWHSALQHAELALEHSERAAHRMGTARCLNAIAWCHAKIGTFEEAIHYGRMAYDAYRDLEDAPGEAGVLDTLGYAYHHLGEHATAIDHLQRALDIWDQHPVPRGRAPTLLHLGDARMATGDPDLARAAWQQALDIFEDLGEADAVEARDRLKRLAASP